MGVFLGLIYLLSVRLSLASIGPTPTKARCPDLDVHVRTFDNLEWHPQGKICSNKAKVWPKEILELFAGVFIDCKWQSKCIL